MKQKIRLIFALNLLSLFLFSFVFSQTFNVSMPVVTVEVTQTQVIVPIIVAEDLTDFNITAYQSQINFDSAVIKFSDYEITGTLTEQWGSSGGWIANLLDNDILTFGQFYPYPLEGSGTIVKLIFDVVGNDGDISNIVFDYFILNSALATTTNGQVRIGNIANQTVPVAPSKLNLISFNVLPENADIESMLDDLETLLIASDDDGLFYIPPYQVNTIGDVDFSNGYKIFITDNNIDNVVNTGIPLIPQSYSHSFTNTKKFSISYPYQNSFPVVDVFATISSNVVIVQDDEGRFWIPSYTVNTIGDMLPGKGYDLFVDQPTSFTYPPLSGRLAKMKTPVSAQPDPKHFQFKKTGLSYAAVIINSEEELCLFDEIGIYADNRCVGAGVYAGKFPVVLAAWEGSEKYSLPGFNVGEKIKFKIWKCGIGEELNTKVTFSNEDESVFGRSPFSVVSLHKAVDSQKVNPMDFSLEQNYPNPFNSTTRIRFQLQENSHIVLKIYNPLGQEIKTLLNDFETAGSHSIFWDGRDNLGNKIVSGIYLYQIRAGDFIRVNKLIIVN
jgi:hypothetical protein